MRSTILLRASVISIIISLISSCVTAPKKFEFDPICSIGCDYESAWNAVIEYFAISNLPVEVLNKESGIISTSWFDASAKKDIWENKDICDCGGGGLTVPLWTRGKFNVYIKEMPDKTLEIRVTSSFQQGRKLSDVEVTAECNSTGKLEYNIHQYVTAIASKSQVPDIPIFSPGHGG